MFNTRLTRKPPIKVQPHISRRLLHLPRSMYQVKLVVMFVDNVPIGKQIAAGVTWCNHGVTHGYLAYD